MQKIGLGGGCHWCTEAVFQSLMGVTKVEQGWLSPANDASAFSEGVLVQFEPKQINLEVLIAIHLHTHSATAEHKMRNKYRSAIYTLEQAQVVAAEKFIAAINIDLNQTYITQVLTLGKFKLNNEKYLNYYYQNPQLPFCQTYIKPKLETILKEYLPYADHEKVKNSF